MVRNFISIWNKESVIGVIAHEYPNRYDKTKKPQAINTGLQVVFSFYEMLRYRVMTLITRTLYNASNEPPYFQTREKTRRKLKPGFMGSMGS